jgi:hypothetical protein
MVVPAEFAMGLHHLLARIGRSLRPTSASSSFSKKCQAAEGAITAG